MDFQVQEWVCRKKVEYPRHMEPLKKQDPKKIGPYTLVARLGSGGMGTVYLASRNEATVALKVVSGGFDDDPALKNRFNREIENLRKTRSAFIAGIIDSKIEESGAWLAVRYVNGPNSTTFVCEGRASKRSELRSASTKPG